MAQFESPIREPLITGNKTYKQITDDIAAPTEGTPPLSWWIAFGLSASLLLFGFICIGWLIYKGVGTWGLDKTVGWAWDITNFVWWVGIGHAGTLISAILLLFRQKWRTAVNRAAEAMTIFAVMCAGLFPLIHMGRIWDAFFIMPYPNTRGPLWPNFNSPLLWDVFAISTYLTVSVLFWYSGLIPDVATLRDRAKNKFRKNAYNLLSFGWTGTAKQWQRFEYLSLVLAGLATPLVLSVHTIVSFDFATSVVKGWHTTIFPPYFVAGAVFSGFAMVLTLMLIARKLFKLEDYITIGHIESMNKVILLTGSIVGVAYLTELFMAFFSAERYEMWAFARNRIQGPMAWAYWIMMSCNVISPQIFWFKWARRNIFITFVMSIFINIGMWFERFVIIVTSTFQDFIPSSWSYFKPTWVDMGIYLGTFGLFFTLFFLFARTLPVIAMAEVKSILRTSGDQFREKTLEKVEDEPVYHDVEVGQLAKNRLITMETKNILVGMFDDDAVFLRAIKEIRSEGLRIDDAFMPFPVHGFEEALGMKGSRLHVGGFWIGLTGLTLMFIFIFTTTNPQIPGFSWPNNWGGKPSLSILAWVPILFEVTVLSAAVSMFFAFIIRNTLFPGKKPIVFDERLTDHMFAITFDTSKMNADQLKEAKSLLTANGAVEIKEAITEKNRLLNIR